MKREEQAYSTNTGEFIAEKLLPCPFCGGEPEFITIGNDYTKSRKAEIKCTKCFVKRTTGAIRNDLEWCGRKAIELWNKRTESLSLPPAEGAEEYYKKEMWRFDFGKTEEKGWVSARETDIIRFAAEFAAQQQPTAGKITEGSIRAIVADYEKWRYGGEVFIDDYLKSRER